MDRETEALILDTLRRHNILTLATVREDGFPQATAVGYVNDRLTIYVGCGAGSQKARNVRRCAKVAHDRPRRGGLGQNTGALDGRHGRDRH